MGAKDLSGRTPLHLAANNGHHAMVRLLGEFGADIDAKTDDGCTPLHIAAHKGYDDAVRVLVEEHGADVGIGTNDGRNFSVLISDRH